jgi:mono/diheme cytochrome c family protein
MFKTKLQDSRRYIGWALLGLIPLALVYFFSPGLPVLIGPWAWESEKTRGGELFSHVWTPGDSLARGDGLGPVFNASSCAACHFQGGLGGAGESKGNVSHYIVRATRQNPAADGMIHAASTAKVYQETPNLLRKLFPVLKGSSTTTRDGHCTYTTTIPDFDPVRMEAINATALFGAGWIDLISSKAIIHQQFAQSFAGTWVELTEAKFDIKPLGKARVLPDGRIGKFGWKAQFATLEEFVAAACANELGLSTPIKDQPAPLGAPTYVSTGTDMSWKQLQDMTAFVSTLPRPIEVLPEQSDLADMAIEGRRLFGKVGCAACHVPDLSGVKGIYSDFLLHDVMTPLDGNQGGGGGGGGYDPPEPPGLPERSPGEPLPNEWKTPPLWGVAHSAPYMHDGASPTLQAAILRHKGDATAVTKAYQKLNAQEKQAIIQFLQTLQAPKDAVAVAKVGK